MAFKIHEITAKSIVTPTKVPSADFIINPYHHATAQELLE